MSLRPEKDQLFLVKRVSEELSSLLLKNWISPFHLGEDAFFMSGAYSYHLPEKKFFFTMYNILGILEESNGYFPLSLYNHDAFYKYLEFVFKEYQRWPGISSDQEVGS